MLRFLGGLSRLLHGGAARQPAGRPRRVRQRHAARPVALSAGRRRSSAPSWCSGCTTTSSRCSWPAPCSPATRSCCAAAACIAAPAAPSSARVPIAVAASRISRSPPATGAVALCGVAAAQPRACCSRGRISPGSTRISPMWPRRPGQFVPSLIGAALMVLAFGLSRRVNLAWGATIVLLLAGAALHRGAGRAGLDPGGAGARDAARRPVPQRLLPPRAAAERPAAGLDGAPPARPDRDACCCWRAFERHVRWLRANSWWEVSCRPTCPTRCASRSPCRWRSRLAALWRLLRPGRVTWLPWRDGGAAPLRRTRRRAASRGGRHRAGARRSARASRSAALGRVLLGPGRPGGRRKRPRLRDLAAARPGAAGRARPGHLARRAELLKVYADLGLTALPLGPDGLPVATTLPTAPSPADAASSCCVAERDLDASCCRCCRSWSRRSGSPRLRREPGHR